MSEFEKPMKEISSNDQIWFVSSVFIVLLLVISFVPIQLPRNANPT